MKQFLVHAAALLALIPASAAGQTLEETEPWELKPTPNGYIAVRGNARPVRAAPPRFALGLAVGTGLGWIYGGSTEHVGASIIGGDYPDTSDGGWAHAPLHLTADLSYHLTDRWQLSLQGRFQLRNFTSAEWGIPEVMSVLGLARLKWFVAGERLRWFVAMGVGGGQIRHRVLIEEKFVDTRAAGLVATNLGTGVSFMFNRTFGLSAELSTFLLLPELAIHGDINLGVVVRL